MLTVNHSFSLSLMSSCAVWHKPPATQPPLHRLTDKPHTSSHSEDSLQHELTLSTEYIGTIHSILQQRRTNTPHACIPGCLGCELELYSLQAETSFTQDNLHEYSVTSISGFIHCWFHTMFIDRKHTLYWIST